MRKQGLTEVLTNDRHFEQEGPPFDREYLRVKAEVTRLSELLAGTQFRLRTLRQLPEEEEKRQYTELNISRYLGRLEADLRIMERAGQDSDLQGEVNAEGGASPGA